MDKIKREDKIFQKWSTGRENSNKANLGFSYLAGAIQYGCSWNLWKIAQDTVPIQGIHINEQGKHDNPKEPYNFTKNINEAVDMINRWKA